MASSIQQELKENQIALRHLINEDPDYLLRQYDQHTLLALEIDVAENIDERVAKKNLEKLSKIEKAISNLRHMNDLYQFMMLKGALANFKQDRLDMIHEKMYAKDKVKHEIEEVIKEQANVHQDQADLKEKISRHFMIAGLIFFPGLPVLIGMSVIAGASYAPIFIVCILALSACILMGEKIIHDFQRREIIKDHVMDLDKRRKNLIKEYLSQSKEIRHLVHNHQYFIHKYGKHIMRKRA